MHELSEKTAGIPEALNNNSRFLQVKVFLFNSFFNTNSYAFSCCSFASLRPSEYDRFSGNKTWRIKLTESTVFIHHPRHNLRVCIDIRCRNIFSRPNYLTDGSHIAAAESL